MKWLLVGSLLLLWVAVVLIIALFVGGPKEHVNTENVDEG